MFANATAERLVGAAPPALAGRLIADVAPAAWAHHAAEMIGSALVARGPVVSEGYWRGALLRARWRAMPGRGRVLVVATLPGVAGPTPPGMDVVRLPPAETEAIARLSAREIEVLTLIARGLNGPRVAAALYRSVRTIEAHRRSIGKKLGLHNVWALTRFAVVAGLVAIDARQVEEPREERSRGPAAERPGS